MTRAEAFEFWVRRPADPAACWGWAGPVSVSNGGNVYPRMVLKGRHIMAHRWAFQNAVQTSIPEGYHIHHACHTTICTNPDHLEMIEAVEHLRGHGRPPATHCVNGHEYTQENTYRWHGDPTKKQCKICQRERQRVRRETVEKKPCTTQGCNNRVLSGRCRTCYRRETGR